MLGGCDTEQLDVFGLSMIHVTGTKGKGKPCALIEFVPRHHGFTTGTRAELKYDGDTQENRLV